MLPKTVAWHIKKLQEKAILRKVIDGSNAPKMTGKSRYKSHKYSHSRGLKDPASASAVYFIDGTFVLLSLKCLGFFL